MPRLLFILSQFPPLPLTPLPIPITLTHIPPICLSRGMSEGASAADKGAAAAGSSGVVFWPWDISGSFVTKTLRMINYGAIAPVFFLYCIELGFDEVSIGALLTGILVGDIVISLYLTTRADAIGRRRVLLIGSALKILAGLTFSFSRNFYVLMAAGVVGVISTSGGECGPLLPVEKAMMGDAYERWKGAAYNKGDLAMLLGWYNALGYAAQAVGALASGVAVEQLQRSPTLHMSALNAYRAVFIAYACIGGLMALLYATMSERVEAAKLEAPKEGGGEASKPAPCCPAVLHPVLPNASFGLRRRESTHIVTRLSVMFALDAFAGAFVLQTWVAFWFHEIWGFSPDFIGYLLMGANVAAGISSLVTPYFVTRYGAMLTMIASHFPSNILLLLVPFMPTDWAASAMLVARFCISQMDVPARDTYVNSVVASDEKSAANGITGIARSVGMSLAPLLLGYLSSQPHSNLLFSSPFIIAGVLKCIYDVTLYGLYLADATMKHGEDRNEAMNKAETADRAKVANDRTAINSAANDNLKDDALDAPLLATQDAPDHDEA
jgi:MFS family permease